MVGIHLVSEFKAVTFRLRDDAHGLIKGSHRLSAGAEAAIATARPNQFGEKEVSCSPDIAVEILAWFKDYETHADLMRQFHWAVPACRRAANGILDALTQHMKNES